ncbi:Protein ssuh2 [Bulinus truncatus]|nr:Protein ssuh2 [Bulinus truncatus]
MERQSLLSQSGSMNFNSTSTSLNVNTSASSSRVHNSQLPAGGVSRTDCTDPIPPYSMDSIPGYSNTNFKGVAVLPPTTQNSVPQPPRDQKAIRRVTTLTEDQAKEALVRFVADHCCYGTGPVREMRIVGMDSSSAFHYCLETFGESRYTKWKCKPSNGKHSVVLGPAPSPWDLHIQPPAMFQPGEVDVEVPNTASVKQCYKCNGAGSSICSECSGSRRVRCRDCRGTGWDDFHNRMCSKCGNGLAICSDCKGSGRDKCLLCGGCGNLCWFILMTVKWANHVGDHIMEGTSLPQEKIKKVSGEIAFEETAPRVGPVNHFSEQQINQASRDLISKHGACYSMERILMQRHKIRIVPVTQVSYSYKDQILAYYVYGFENKRVEITRGQ